MESSGLQNIQVKAFLVCDPGKSSVRPSLKISAAPVATSCKTYDVVNQGKTRNMPCDLSNKGIVGHWKVTEKGTEYICDVDKCQRSFTSLTYLRIHQNSHSKKELKCTHPGCGRKFVWPHHLKYHLQAHKGEKPFKCDVENCNKAFGSAQQREVHKRTHTGIKPFVCEVCNKTFITQQNRDSHHRTHTGSKPFRCDFAGCEKAFAESSSLKKHVLVHTGDKPHKCVHCNKRFTQISTLRVHERRFHIENAMPTRSIANIQAQQKAAAIAAAKAAAEEMKQKDSQISRELSTPSSLVYPESSSPFITDSSITSITCLNEPLEGVPNLTGSNMLTSQMKTETGVPSDSNPGALYEETYDSDQPQADLVVCSDEPRTVFEGESEEVIIEQNEIVTEGDYRMFHILEETVVESEIAE